MCKAFWGDMAEELSAGTLDYITKLVSAVTYTFT